MSFIACSLQRLNLSSELLLIPYSAAEILPAEDADFNLRHVQPVAMLGRVVKFPPLGDSPCFQGLKGLIKRSHLMGVQIIQCHVNDFRFRVSLIRQPFHLRCKVLSTSLIAHCHMPLSAWARREKSAHPVAFVLVIHNVQGAQVEPKQALFSPKPTAWASYQSRQEGTSDHKMLHTNQAPLPCRR